MATVRLPDLEAQMHRLGRAAREAARAMAAAPRSAKDRALEAGARALRERCGEILEANARDMAAARDKGLSGAMLDRLELDPRRVEAMAAGLEAIAGLEDPVGTELARWRRLYGKPAGSPPQVARRQAKQ